MNVDDPDLDALNSVFVSNMVEEKPGIQTQYSKKRFEMNEHACSVERILRFSNWTACLYLKVACSTWKIQSSDRSKSEKQESLTPTWGSLA